MASLPDAEGWIENRPTRVLRWPDPKELWQYRELAGFLALRDLKVRYKQAVFGAAWAVLQPLAAVVVFTVVFEHFAKVSSDGIPYPVFALAGLTVWSYASTTVIKTTQSLVSNESLVTKVYFPRLLVPVAALFPALVDLLLSLVVLLIFVLSYHVHPSWALVTLPLWIIQMMLCILGIGLLLGALNVSYRDINQAISLFVQLWMFVSPVAYPSSAVPAFWRPLYFVNPMAGVIEGFRWSALGVPWPGRVVFLSLVTTIVLLIGGIAFFGRTERRFADVI
jgi:ABC-type polysaccharide/polyol phosphate export permease